MAKKSLGFTRLIWTCPNCGTRNPGPVKMCSSCGNPQPKDVHFEQAAKEVLITDAEEIKKAKAGADIHCPFCGARNPAGAKTCSQCLGDLAGGVRRESGKVVGAHRKEEAPPLICPSCGSPNPPYSSKCARCGAPFAKKKAAASAAPSKSGRLVLIGIGLLALVGILCLLSRCMSKDSITGTVSQVSWERSIAVEEYQWVAHENWWDEIPDEAEIEGCEERYRYTSAEPAENSVEVCGTPYTVDSGSGHAEVVQDCQYEVYDNYCDYFVAEWVLLENVVESGVGINAYWPSVQIDSSQRTGQQNETYTITFETSDGMMNYKTDDFSLFQRAGAGSQWDLVVDGFGNILEASPR